MGKKAALLALALAVAGLCILLWPVVSGHRLQADMSAAAQGFLEEARQSYPSCWRTCRDITSAFIRSGRRDWPMLRLVRSLLYC